MHNLWAPKTQFPQTEFHRMWMWGILDTVVIRYTSCFSSPRIPPRFRAAAASKDGGVWIFAQKTGRFGPHNFFWVAAGEPFSWGTTINEKHLKDVCWWRFGENPSSRCRAVASKGKETKQAYTERMATKPRDVAFACNERRLITQTADYIKRRTPTKFGERCFSHAGPAASNLTWQH